MDNQVMNTEGKDVVETGTGEEELQMMSVSAVAKSDIGDVSVPH